MAYPESQLSVRISMPAAKNQLIGALRDTMQNVSLGLRGVASIPDGLVELPDVFFRIFYEKLPSASVDSRDSFRTWILAIGLRDAIDAFMTFLEEIRVIAGMIQKAAAGEICVPQTCTAGELPNVFRGAELLEFPRALNDRLDYLQENFCVGMSIREVILSINQARNCLTHRRGRVGSEDVKQDDKKKVLRISYRRFELVCGSPGADERICRSGQIVEKGKAVWIRHAAAERCFSLGTTIEFTPQEFNDILSTLCECGCALIRDLESLARQRHLLVSTTK